MKKYTISNAEKINLKNFDPEDTDGLSKEDIQVEYLKLQEKFKSRCIRDFD